MPRGRPRKNAPKQTAKTVKQTAKKPYNESTAVEQVPVAQVQPKPLPPKLDELADVLTERMKNVYKEADISQLVTIINNGVQLALVPFYSKLERLLLVCARLAAADTMRTSQMPETVFDRAIDEADVAKKQIDGRVS